MGDERDDIEQSEAFLLYLQNDDHERRRLEHAVLERIVEAGREKGFNFTPQALEKVAAIQYKMANIWHPPR